MRSAERWKKWPTRSSCWPRPTSRSPTKSVSDWLSAVSAATNRITLAGSVLLHRTDNPAVHVADHVPLRDPELVPNPAGHPSGAGPVLPLPGNRACAAAGAQDRQADG